MANNKESFYDFQENKNKKQAKNYISGKAVKSTTEC